MRETFRVNSEEYSIIQKLKNIQGKLKNKQELTEEEYLFLLPKEEYSTLKSAKLRENSLNKENMQHQRIIQLKRNEVKINQMQREIDFKNKQVKDQEWQESSENFVMKAKPEFYLQNEIDEITLHMEELKEQNKAINEEIDKDKNVSRN